MLDFGRCNADVPCLLKSLGFVKIRGERWNGKQSFSMTAGRKKLSESAPLEEEGNDGNGAVGGKKSSKSPKKGGARTTKKKVVATDEPLEESSELLVDNDVLDKESTVSALKPKTRTRKKGMTFTIP